MSTLELHTARRALVMAQDQIIRAYERASENWPAMPTVAAQSAFSQAQAALVPVAIALGTQFSVGFCARWDEAIAAITARQTKPGKAPQPPCKRARA